MTEHKDTQPYDSVGGAGPCIGLLELASIAAGYETTDALHKEAAVSVLQARAVTPGKFVILFTGSVEDVSSALRRGLEIGADTLLDSLYIPNIEPTLLEFYWDGRIEGRAPFPEEDDNESSIDDDGKVKHEDGWGSTDEVEIGLAAIDGVEPEGGGFVGPIGYRIESPRPTGGLQ